MTHPFLVDMFTALKGPQFLFLLSLSEYLALVKMETNIGVMHSATLFLFRWPSRPAIVNAFYHNGLNAIGKALSLL